MAWYAGMSSDRKSGPVAQSAERWTPRGERTRRALDAYEPPGGYGYG